MDVLKEEYATLWAMILCGLFGFTWWLGLTEYGKAMEYRGHIVLANIETSRRASEDGGMTETDKNRIKSDLVENLKAYTSDMGVNDIQIVAPQYNTVQLREKSSTSIQVPYKAFIIEGYTGESTGVTDIRSTIPFVGKKYIKTNGVQDYDFADE